MSKRQERVSLFRCLQTHMLSRNAVSSSLHLPYMMEYAPIGGHVMTRQSDLLPCPPWTPNQYPLRPKGGLEKSSWQYGS